MAEGFFIKLPNGALTPASEKDREILKPIKLGQAVKVSIKRVRNYQFHKKVFTLFQYLYEIWEPPENQVAHKDFDRFRKDLTILAGYYDQTIRVDGSTRVEAKSLSFANMDEDTFENLYLALIETGVKYVCVNYTGDELREIMEVIDGYH